MKLDLVLAIVLAAAFLASSGGFRLSSQRNPRQDEVEENESGATAETTTSAPHLIGTLAGVLSSILRSGPNGTSPIKFNLTETLQRLTRFQIKLPTFPSFSTTRQNVSPDGNVTLLGDSRIGRKRLNYRNPWSQKTNGINLHSEFEPITSTLPTQSLQEEDYDDGVGATTKKTAAISNQPRQQYVPPSTFPIYPVASTSADPQEVETVRVPAAHPPHSIPTTKTAETTVYPHYPVYTTEATFQLQNIDIGGMASWLEIYLNPAINLAKGATRNLTISQVVNGTAEGVLTGVEGVKKGVASVASSIPKLAEVISGLVDFFEDIE